MEQWLTPGARGLLIVVTSLNLVGLSGLISGFLTLHYLLRRSTTVAAGCTRTFVAFCSVYFGQFAALLIITLASVPSIWPLLIVFAAGTCLYAFLVVRAFVSLYAGLRPLLPPQHGGPLASPESQSPWQRISQRLRTSPRRSPP